MADPYRTDPHDTPISGEAEPDSALPHGASVLTRDGHRLGRVKESSRGCFLIDVPLAFDYWLSSRAVAGMCDGDLVLGIDKSEVGGYLVDVDCLDDFDDLPTVTGDGTEGGMQVAAAST